MADTTLSPAPSAARPASASGVAVADTRLRALVALGVSLVALLLRWPYLQLVPRITDETAEIKWAIRIYQGEILPLTHTDPYNGPVQPYLMAALFKLFGLDPDLPRAMTAVLGAALAGVVAWWAWGLAAERESSRQQAASSKQQTAGGLATRRLPAADCLLPALLAAALIATSFPLIVVNSHIAWSSCLTPLLTTIALGVTWSAVVHAKGWRLVLAGVLWGVAWQTHPSVIALLPGVAAWILLQPVGRGWLRTRWAWLGVGGFLLGYGNMIVYNLTTRANSVDEALNSRNAYGIAPGLDVYFQQLGGLVVQGARMLSGTYAIQPDGSVPVLVTPMTVVYGALALVALVWAARRPITALLPLTVLSGALILPIVSHAFSGLHDSRYIAYLLPPTYLSLALLVTRLMSRPAEGKPGRRWLVTAVAALLVLYPLLPLARFYQDSERYGLTNAGLIRLADEAKTVARQGSVVLLDRDMRDVKLGGGGDPVRAVESLLTLGQTPFQTARPDTINWYLLNSEAPLFLVLSDRTAATLAARYPLTATPLTFDGFAAFTAPAPK